MSLMKNTLMVMARLHASKPGSEEFAAAASLPPLAAFVSLVLYLDKSAFMDSSLSPFYPSKSAVLRTFESFAFIITQKGIELIQFKTQTRSFQLWGQLGYRLLFVFSQTTWA